MPPETLTEPAPAELDQTHDPDTDRPSVDTDRLYDLLADRRAGLATDFDGTISPIVSPPEAAAPLPGVEASLRTLTDRLTVVALVSGRAVADLALRVDVPGAIYIGNHGLEWWRDRVDEPPHPTLTSPTQLAATPTADESRLLAAAADTLRRELDGLVGIRLEDKGLAVAIHYRDAPADEPARERILTVCHDLVGQRLQIREGKHVVELVLPRGTDKGTALERLVDELGLEALAFIGDDLTDRDGFAACHRLRERGVDALALAVLGAETPPAVVESADATVPGPEGVAELLAQLSRRLAAAPPT